MKDVIYLYADRYSVVRMRKSLGEFKRGEIPIKLTVNIKDKAFTTPTIEQSIWIDDMNPNIDIEDVKFNRNIITQEEAEEIKKLRIEKMKSLLETQGYVINHESEVEKE